MTLSCASTASIGERIMQIVVAIAGLVLAVASVTAATFCEPGSILLEGAPTMALARLMPAIGVGVCATPPEISPRPPSCISPSGSRKFR